MNGSQKQIRVEYICTYCGKKEIKFSTSGRPVPGICVKNGKTSDGRTHPHSWRLNRKLI